MYILKPVKCIRGFTSINLIFLSISVLNLESAVFISGDSVSRDVAIG